MSDKPVDWSCPFWRDCLIHENIFANRRRIRDLEADMKWGNIIMFGVGVAFTLFWLAVIKAVL